MSRQILYFLTLVLVLSHAVATNFEGTNKPVMTDTVTGRQSLFPLYWTEMYGFILIIFIAGLANAGGLGGGPILSPILIMIFGYSESHAIEMVYALVFGASLGNFLNVVTKRDPKTQKPLIEYNLAIICMPLMLLGTCLGVILNRMLAPLITIAGILGVTLYSLSKLYAKAKKTYREESNREEDLIKVLDDCTVLSDDLDNNQGTVAETQLQEVIQEEQKLLPPKKIGMTFVLIFTIMILAVLRGTKNFSSFIGISYCGPVYWGFLGLAALLCFIILYTNKKLLDKSLQVKKLFNIQTTRTKFELTQNHIPKLLTLSSIAGVLAGLLGIGGGMIMSPTLINMGVPARSLAATTGFFVVQTSFISIFQSLLYQDVSLADMGFFFAISIAGSFGVSFLLTSLVNKYNRPSLVLFTLVIVLALSLVTTPIFEIVKNVNNFDAMLQFSSVC